MRLQAARDIAGTISTSSNRVFLNSDSLLLNLVSAALPPPALSCCAASCLPSCLRLGRRCRPAGHRRRVFLARLLPLPFPGYVALQSSPGCAPLPLLTVRAGPRGCVQDEVDTGVTAK